MSATSSRSDQIAAAAGVNPQTALLRAARAAGRTRAQSGRAPALSADQGANGIILVDLVTEQAWRRLHDHPSTRTDPVSTFRPLVEGGSFLQRPSDGPARPVGIGADGIAISADGAPLYYCSPDSRRLHSVRFPGGEYETVVHDPGLLWSEALSVASDGHLLRDRRPSAPPGRFPWWYRPSSAALPTPCSALPSTRIQHYRTGGSRPPRR